jgi:3-oxoacyl-(acyl-carrier-protein) synthase/acyl carrier protein
LSKLKLSHCTVVYAWSFIKSPLGYEQHKSTVHNFFSLCAALLKKKPFQSSQALYLFNTSEKAFTQVHGGVSGFAKSVHQESNKLKISLLGIDKSPEQMITFIAEDINKSRLPVELQYHNSSRQEKAYRHSFLQLAGGKPEQNYRDGDVYLITGGAGGLGLKIARHISQQSHCHLVICGRSESPVALHSELTGVEYSYLKADVSNEGQVQQLLSNIIQQHGKLDGIFHCAGGLNDELLINKNLATCDAVIAPKVEGCIYLDEASKACNLKFFVMFSSVTAILGNMGQTDYGYANSVLDSFSEARNRLVSNGERSGKTISINWPLWADGGMSTSEQAIKYFMQATGVTPLDSATGLSIVDYAIGHVSGAAFIAQGDLEKIAAVTAQRAYYQIADNLPNQPTLIDHNSVTTLLERDLFELAGNILGSPTSIFDKEAEFSTLGFDSISNTEFATAINNKYRTEITPVAFFEYQTFSEFINYLIKDYEPLIIDFYKLASSQPAAMQNQSRLPSPIQTTSGMTQDLPDLLLQTLRTMAAGIVKIASEEIEPSATLGGYGFDSISNTEFTNAINSTFNIDVTPVLFFEYETLQQISEFICNEYQSVIKSYYQNSIENTTSVNNYENIKSHVISEPVIPDRHEDTFRNNIETPHSRFSNNEDIAIIGMQGLLPQSDSLATFWQLLLDGKDLVHEVPATRWSWEEYFGDARTQPGKTKAKWGSFIHDIDKFDAAFFNIRAEDARLMDPQQRLFIQLVWQTIEDAGYKPSDFSGTKTGLYVGLSNRDYFDYLQKQQVAAGPESSFGNNHAFLVNRISYLFNFNGPSEPIDTLCSSSLVAIHRAVQDLHAGLCQHAIVGGISLLISPLLSTVFEQAGMLSPEGRCRTFDAEANGFVRGEGAGALLLKPLAHAVRDGDNVIAIIKGSAVNHGGRANSLTAPNLNAQADLLIQAWSSAGVDPNTISYIETHGTGTKLGDAIEINAIKKAFKTLKHTDSLVPLPNCGLGSIKTNIGHLESASGIASVMKVLLAMRYEQLPGLVHLNEVNPYIDLRNTPLQLVDKNQDWPLLKSNEGQALPRRAGINAFGAGGVNAHIVVEEYQSAASQFSNETNESVMIILSAKDKTDLTANAKNLIHHLTQHPPRELERVAYTLQVGRESFAHRLAVITSDMSHLLSALESFVNNVASAGYRYADTSSVDNGSNDDSALADALLRRDFPALANYWLDGANPDWKLCYQGKQMIRVSLPGYSFKKTRHWADAAPENSTTINSTKHQAFAGPRAVSEPVIYQQQFAQGEPYLADHKVFNDEVLLGVTYASMAIEATRNLQFNRIQRLLFVNPLALYTGETARVAIHRNERNEFRATFQVSGNPEQKTAATGLLASVTTERMFVAPQLRSHQFSKSLSQQQVYATLRAQGVDYSHSLLGVTQLLVGSGVALGKVEVNQKLLHSTPDYYLHPVWLDAAIVCAKAAFLDTISSTYIPFSFNDIVIHTPPKHSSFCYVQLVKLNEQIFTCNAQLCDADGSVQIDIQGMVCKRIRVEEEMQFASKKSEPLILGS